MLAKALLLSAALLVVSAAAQTPPCASLNDGNNVVSGALSSFGFGGPNRRAWQFTPATALGIASARIFTGNTTVSSQLNFMTLEIWSDSGANLPGTRIAGGTWAISVPRGNAWQGCDFDQPISMSAGVPYWIVWIDPGFSTIPVGNGGTTLPTANGSPFTTLAPSALKFRLYCTALDDANVAVLGSGCAAASGNYGSTFTNWTPNLGNSNFTLEGSGFPSGAAAILVVGVTPGFPSLPIPGAGAGCNLESDILFYLEGTTGIGNVRATTALGHVKFAIPIPNDPGLLGLIVTAQLAAVDLASPNPLPVVVGNGLSLTLF